MSFLWMAAALVAILSAAAYLRRRAWPDAALTLLAGAALAGMIGQFPLPGDAGASLTVSPATRAADVQHAPRLRVDGDGLSAAYWRDLPARPLDWTEPASAVLSLDFPRETTLGRHLRVSLTRQTKGEARLQLLAENGQLLAEAKSSAPTLSVDWLPPVAEDLVLRARLLDAAGKTVAEGPLPVRVRAPLALQVQGRFQAPSFDAQTLNALLVASGANVDWQVTLGKGISRSETAREASLPPELLLVDAAQFERAAAPARAAMLAQVAQGASLIVLGANASDSAVWAAALQLSLRQQADAEVSSAGLLMQSTPLAPQAGGPWQAVENGIVARDWQQGRILYIGLTDWHRNAITEPQKLGQWWQTVLDAARVRRLQDVTWLAPDSMPLPGERSEICALGVSGQAVLPQLKQSLEWQLRPERADARCIAVWPRQSGWLDIEWNHQRHRVYVFDAKDWPQWQAAEKRAATRAYQARTPQAAGINTRQLPAWPFALVFMLAAFGLWWRERR